MTIDTRPASGGVELHIELQTRPESVPGTLLLPPGGAAPVVLMLHGIGSSRDRMVQSVGHALLQRGIASLAVDLPMHGGRPGDVRDLSIRAPLEVIRAWKLAVAEAREAVWLLADDRRFDASRMGIVGYSLGAYLATIVAAEEPGLGAILLAAGGDLPANIPFGSLVRSVADPVKAIRRVAGRPLLMVNGRYDRTIAAAQAENLFAAAGEPKSMHWYNGGHWPPPAAITAAANWLADVLLGKRSSAPDGASRTTASRSSANRRSA